MGGTSKGGQRACSTRWSSSLLSQDRVQKLKIKPTKHVWADWKTADGTVITLQKKSVNWQGKQDSQPLYFYVAPRLLLDECLKGQSDAVEKCHFDLFNSLLLFFKEWLQKLLKGDNSDSTKK